MSAWVKDDGGRADAGFSGEAGDCACRAVAIAAQVEYEYAYRLINAIAESETRRSRPPSNARTGVWRDTMDKVMGYLGFTSVPTMKVGEGCRVHVRPDELPGGRIVLRLSRHYTAFVDGVLHDTHDSSRGGTRCVYGYWQKGGE